MGLNDFIKAAPDSSTPAEGKAVIEKIEERLQRIKQLLQEKRVQQGRLRMWINFLRTQLTIIYGKNSDIIKFIVPIHGKLPPDVAADRDAILITQAETFISNIKESGRLSFAPRKVGKVFIGHGRSLLWRELKDFLSDRLGLGWDEFNREAVAGFTTFERLSQMLLITTLF